MKILVHLLLLFAVLPAEARFHRFLPGPTVKIPYYQRPEWIEYHTQEKAVVIDIAPPQTQEDIFYYQRRLEEIMQQIITVQGKLNFPGIMSLKYRQHLEKELAHLKKERDHIRHLLKQYSSRVVIENPQVIVDPFVVYPRYSHHYPAFRKFHH